MADRPYDALLVDLDGTLLTSDEELHPRTEAALAEARAQGVRVMTVTGRSKQSAAPVIERLSFETPTVLFNGCAVWCPREERLIEERILSNRVNRRLHAWAAKREAQVIVMTADRKLALTPRSAREEKNLDGLLGVEFVSRDELFCEYTIRLSFLVECDGTSERIARELETAAGSPVYVSHFPLAILPRHRSSPYSAVDAHPPCRGKAEALRLLEELHGIPADRVVAVGDGENDVPMLRAAGLGVVMENAMDEAKAVADRVIGHHDTGTIGQMIEELFLGAGRPS